MHTLDIAPLRESSPQKRSGMARVLKGSHVVLPAHPRVHPQSEWAIPALLTYLQCHPMKNVGAQKIQSIHNNKNKQAWEKCRPDHLSRLGRAARLTAVSQRGIWYEQTAQTDDNSPSWNVKPRHINVACSVLQKAPMWMAVYCIVGQGHWWFRIDTEIRCVGAHPPFWPFEPARVEPN